jgi:hypothetical protein
MTLDIKRMSMKPLEQGVQELDDLNLQMQVSRDYDDFEDIANAGTVKQDENIRHFKPCDL